MIREIRDAGLAAWIGPDDFVTVPTAAEGEPPREWFERLYNVRQWTPTRRERAVNSLPGAAISPNDQPRFSPGHDSEKRATGVPDVGGGSETPSLSHFPQEATLR